MLWPAARAALPADADFKPEALAVGADRRLLVLSDEGDRIIQGVKCEQGDVKLRSFRSVSLRLDQR